MLVKYYKCDACDKTINRDKSIEIMITDKSKSDIYEYLNFCNMTHAIKYFAGLK